MAVSPVIAELRNLRFERESTDGLTFELYVAALAVSPGDKIAIAGPSGIGKSTLLDLLALCLPATGGEYALYEHAEPVDVVQLWKPVRPSELCRLRRHLLGYILQTGGLLPFLSARRNILLSAEVPDELGALAETLQLSDELLKRKPATLSLGERQRVAIARALIHRPRLVLADEPTASLDPANAERTLRLLCDAAARLGCAVVLVTHNPEMARAHGFTLLQLMTGEASTPSRQVSVLRQAA